MRFLLLILLANVLHSQNVSNVSMLPSPYDYKRSGWNFTKYEGNYLINGINGSNGIEFYPPKVYYEGVGDLKVLGKVNNQIWRSTSTDGLSWVTPSLTISKGTSGQWDDIMVAPTCFTKESTTYKVFYSAYGDSPVYNYKIGFASTTTFSTGWTKSPSYQYDVTDYNTENSTSWVCIQCSDAVLVGTAWYYFGLVFDNNFNQGSLCYGVGSPGGSFETIKLDTKIADFNGLNSSFTWCQGLSVFKNPTSGEWYMTLNCGNLANNSTVQNQSIYVFKSGRTDLPIFEQADFISTPIMVPDISKIYENNYNYNSMWLKDNEGNLISMSGYYHFYYGGHQNTATSFYTGVTCLATINEIP